MPTVRITFAAAPQPRKARPSRLIRPFSARGRRAWARHREGRYTDQAMSSAAKEILEAALKLPLEERERLIAELAASLPSDFASSEIERAWLDEIGRRSDEIDAVTAETLEWSDVRAQIAQRRARRSDR
jgi:putative addiction module component (TIGR02574 family)